jgi:hypothetical protein
MKTEEEEDLDAMLDSTLDDFLKTVDGPTNNSNRNLSLLIPYNAFI